MENNTCLSVALMGIPKLEEKRLHNAFEHSLSRNRSYSTTTLENLPSILMVNADDPASLIQWRVYRDWLEDQNKKEPSSVIVSKNRKFNTKHYQVRRPLISSRVISILDQLVANEFDVEEEVAIYTEEAYTGDENAPQKDRGSFRVLVVDDSLPVRIQMEQALKQFASNIDFAETGEQAFNFIDNHTYNIIFLDVVLPGIDGYEICNAIKEGRAKHTPVIMLTGNSSPEDRIKGKLAGCDTYLIKPVTKVIFQEVVGQYLH